jgi:leucyl-tRNA synthetase
LRYTDPKNKDAIASKEALDYWTPVDWYNGGMEHTTLHLLYSRFWHKFLYDIGVVKTPEPYAKRTSHGMILGENGEKMSKSRGNVVNPDEIINEYGADTMRLYEMFIGDFEKAAPWSSASIKGCKRFLERATNLSEKFTNASAYSKENENAMHRTIKKVTSDIENLKFNTAIAAMMSLVNEFYDNGVNSEEYKTLLILLNPFAPHITEELWEICSFGGMANAQKWPSYDEAKTVENEIEIAIQVNGKLKATVVIPSDCGNDEALKTAYASEKVAAALENTVVLKEIVVKNKLINFVVKPK